MIGALLAISLTLSTPHLVPPLQFHVENDGPSQQAVRNMTIGIMAGAALALILWDVYAGKHHETESKILAEGARTANSLPFACGVLVGHWFFNRADVDYHMWPYALVALVLVAVWDVLANTVLTPPAWSRNAGLWFAIGVPVGSIFWGQATPRSP